LHRAASSIPANIAESWGRSGEPDFTRFLQIAMSSASELEYHILLAHDPGYIDHPTYHTRNDQVIEVEKMLVNLIGTIKK